MNAFSQPALRSITRFFLFGLIVLAALLSYLIFVPIFQTSDRSSKKALWLRYWCGVICSWFHYRVKTHGTLPVSGILVSNHLSYLDVITLSAAFPCIFVAKKEVQSWPIMGPISTLAGTVFIDRERATSLKPVISNLENLLQSPTPVIIFPEGTSSGGDSVLPFRTPLFQCLVNSASLVTPAAINYNLEGGSVSEEICYWKDMRLLPHLWNLFSKSEIFVTICFGSSQRPVGDRKQLASQLHHEVVALRRRYFNS